MAKIMKQMDYWQAVEQSERKLNEWMGEYAQNDKMNADE